MGFLEYAWAISFQKDDMKTKIRLDPKLQQPSMMWRETGFDINLPLPSFSKEGALTYFGHQFSGDQEGKRKVGRLFRACVVHLTTHTLMPIPDDKKFKFNSKRTLPEIFSYSLATDLYVNAYISARHADRFADLAFANSLAFEKMKPVEKIFNPATRIMAASLSKVNVGLIKGSLPPEEEEAVSRLTVKLSSLKDTIIRSLAGEEIKLDEVLDETATSIVEILESHGPVLEAPSMQHTEKIGPCSIFSQINQSSGTSFEQIFRKSLDTLGGMLPSDESLESCWRKESDAEASQAFENWFHQKDREERMLAKLRESFEWTRFKSIEFPEEDYTQYLRSRTLLAGGSRRLLDSLRVAQDALDEDPGKEMGQLDLSAVIQVLASRKPATDVFVLDEYLSRSFAWGVLFDVSESMKIKGEFGRALIICVAEATKELLMDSASWTLFGFSDHFYVLKDSSEAYSRRIRARIGGLRFGGLTYMPEAIQIAGNILMKRYDEQRFLVVVSDGCPYGYPNIQMALSESIEALQKKGVIVIGVGVETDKMGNFFRLNCAVHDQKDMIKKFSRIYMNASAVALET